MSSGKVGRAVPENELRSLLKGLPAVDALLSREEIRSLEDEFGRELLLAELRGFLTHLRKEAIAGLLSRAEIECRSRDAAVEVRSRLERRTAFSLQRVINATGVIVHTNLGRAPLSPDTARRVAELSSVYSNLDQLAWMRYLTLWPKIGDKTASKINLFLLNKSMTSPV